MSHCFNAGCSGSQSTPVKTLKPGDLDKEQNKKENSENAEGKANKNGRKCSVLLSRLFCSSKGAKTKEKKLKSDSPAVSSEDGAHCSPD